MSASKPKWLEIVVEGYEQDPESKQLLTELSIAGSNSKGYQLTDGVIRYKGKVYGIIGSPSSSVASSA
jgi:hypothetical protein